MNGCSDHQAQPQSSNCSRSDLDGPSSVVPPKRSPCWRVPTGWGSQHSRPIRLPCLPTSCIGICFFLLIARSLLASRGMSQKRILVTVVIFNAHRTFPRHVPWVWCTAA
ncbi:hypothetical protein PspLS_03693 [Pyricularia sp. CBS 133598]|nr:hypothetical protein PspLS_03693 [Pyricularia sp. CBS 133598]